jgi:hypothetical protein
VQKGFYQEEGKIIKNRGQKWQKKNSGNARYAVISITEGDGLTHARHAAQRMPMPR